jgi:hypothetical protein
MYRILAKGRDRRNRSLELPPRRNNICWISTRCDIQFFSQHLEPYCCYAVRLQDMIVELLPLSPGNILLNFGLQLADSRWKNFSKSRDSGELTCPFRDVHAKATFHFLDSDKLKVEKWLVSGNPVLTKLNQATHGNLVFSMFKYMVARF